MKTKKILRFAKIVLLGISAVYFTLVVLGNLTDYGTNYEFVKHVMRMDDTFMDPDLMWRSVDSEIWYHIFYWIIIITEIVAAVLLWIGFVKLFSKMKANSQTFNNAKSCGLLGLIVGLILWFLYFMTIGGEWFSMWQSETWNGLDAAGRMFFETGISFIIVMLEDK
ncbi:DUF2165 family protein [Candidatus Peregrinibacteria bacterium]|nr:DUF2165 family protein [Candidatus Peregrinibacteria bacterium]